MVLLKGFNTFCSPVVTICTAQWSLHVPHSGHYMYRTVVTIFTVQWSLYVPYSGHYMYHQFNIQQFHILPTQCIYVWISEQTAIISLYSMKWLVFITETECVSCAVGAQFLNVYPVNFCVISLPSQLLCISFWTLTTNDNVKHRHLYFHVFTVSLVSRGDNY